MLDQQHHITIIWQIIAIYDGRILSCEICTLLLDDILIERIAAARIMIKHLDVLHRKLLQERKNCQACQALLLMIDKDEGDNSLEEIKEHIKALHKEINGLNVVSY